METPLLTYGPEIEEKYITAGLDFYKPTMSQFVYEMEPDAEVTFTFKNRGGDRLLDYIDPTDLQNRLDAIQERGFQPAELDHLATLNNDDGERMFQDPYLVYLAENPLPDVCIDVVNDDLAITATGKWAIATFWETVVMSEVNEMYFENKVRAEGIDLFALYEEGDRRLTDKITFLQQHPDIKIAEFGTRRRFSQRWQQHVIERMKNECPGNLIGTSNVAFANTMDLKPVGTFAHELPMGYAGLADARGEDIRASHGNMLDDWYDFYGDELAVALSDTFGSDFFFEDFTLERAAKYRATRHDSGNPVDYGEKAIQHYHELGIDPTKKGVLFSDALNMQKVGELDTAFENRINHPFGVGTNLTNDMGLQALSIVMKLTSVKDPATGKTAETVKLSDDPGKHTGPVEKVTQYQQIFTTRKEQTNERHLAVV